VKAHTSVFHSPAPCVISTDTLWLERLLVDGGNLAEPQNFFRRPARLFAKQVYQNSREHERRHLCSPLKSSSLASNDRLCARANRVATEMVVSSAIVIATATTTRKKKKAPVTIALTCTRGRRPLRDAWARVAARRRATCFHENRFNESRSPCTRSPATLGMCHPVHLARRFPRRFGTTSLLRRRLRARFVCRRVFHQRQARRPRAAAGFADQGHLTPLFKHLTGCTPSQYRNPPALYERQRVAAAVAARRARQSRYAAIRGPGLPRSSTLRLR